MARGPETPAKMGSTHRDSTQHRTEIHDEPEAFMQTGMGSVPTMIGTKWPAGALHVVQRRYLVEDLVRLRRSDEQRRYAAPQRAAKIDANPHQVEAVIFALARLREGGCILADEVGLGKTIEAGLVVAQLLAEGARRVLLIAPKALLGQWRSELFTLFGLEAAEGTTRPGGFDGDGIFWLVARSQAARTGMRLWLPRDRSTFASSTRRTRSSRAFTSASTSSATTTTRRRARERRAACGICSR